MSIIEHPSVTILEQASREEWERSMHQRWQEEDLAIHALTGAVQKPILHQVDPRIDIGSWRAYAEEEFKVPQVAPTADQREAAEAATETLIENLGKIKKLIETNLPTAIEQGYIPAFAEAQHYAALNTPVRVLATRHEDLEKETKAFRDENDGTTTALSGLDPQAQFSKMSHEILGHGAAGGTFIIQGEHEEGGVLAKGDKSFAGIQNIRSGDSTRLPNPNYNPDMPEDMDNEKYIYTKLVLEEVGAETARLGLITGNFEMDPRQRNDQEEVEGKDNPGHAVNARVAISMLYEMSQGLMDPRVFLRSRYRNNGPGGGDDSVDVRERTRQERMVWGRGFRRKANDLAAVVFNDSDYTIEQVEKIVAACVKPPLIKDGNIIKQGEILDIEHDRQHDTKKLEAILKEI